ncbi:MAG: GcrA family cell cycle regulator [Filomicrobium sp.]
MTVGKTAVTFSVIDVTQSDWTDEVEDCLRNLRTDGVSGNDAAAYINSKFKTTFSRQAIIAKWNRMGLGRPNDPRVALEKRNGARKARKGDSTARLPTSPIPETTGVARKPLVDMQRPEADWLNQSCECRWPVGDPKEKGFGFCSMPAVPGKPYCVEHMMLAYQMPLPKQQARQQVAAAAGENSENETSLSEKEFEYED